MWAILASVVVLPVPLIPTNNMRNGLPWLFFALIRLIRSTLPARVKQRGYARDHAAFDKLFNFFFVHFGANQPALQVRFYGVHHLACNVLTPTRKSPVQRGRRLCPFPLVPFRQGFSLRLKTHYEAFQTLLEPGLRVDCMS